MLASDHICLVQEHRLANSAEPIENEAASELAGSKALERDREIVELRIAAGKQRRPRSGAWRVRF
jgi:hypothetical protein